MVSSIRRRNSGGKCFFKARKETLRKCLALVSSSSSAGMNPEAEVARRLSLEPMLLVKKNKQEEKSTWRLRPSFISARSSTPKSREYSEWWAFSISSKRTRV